MRTLLLLVGCTPEAPVEPTPTVVTPVVEDPIVVHAPDPRAPTREALAIGGLAVGVTGDGGLITHDGARLTWHDPLLSPADMGLFTGELGEAARLPGGELLVQRDGVLQVWDPVDGGIWRSTPLNAEVTGLLGWVDLDEALWLEDDAGLRRFDGSFEGYTLDDQPIRAPWAVGGVIHGTPAVWASADGRVVGITERASGWQALEVVEVEPFDLGVDATGTLIVAGQDGLVHLRDPDGLWTRHDVGVTVHRVFASPRAAGAWLRFQPDGGGEGWLHLDAGVFSTVALTGAREPAIDALGRLVRVEADGVARWSVGRPVQVIGVRPEELVDGLVSLTLAPTAPERVISVSASLSGVAQTIAGPPWEVTYDLSSAPPGSHELEVTVAYDDSEQGSANVRFWTGDPDAPTWSDDVLPIQQDRCAVCHNGGTVTLLDTRERWEAGMDAILEQVDLGAMPLSGAPLTPDEIATLRAWRDGGFLP